MWLIQAALPRALNRLINLVAEDNAIEDTMYHLHRALNAGRIDLERFLRVRHRPFFAPFSVRAGPVLRPAREHDMTCTHAYTLFYP